MDVPTQDEVEPGVEGTKEEIEPQLEDCQPVDVKQEHVGYHTAFQRPFTGVLQCQWLYGLILGAII